MAGVSLSNPFAETRPTMKISSDAGGVGIQLPSRFAARHNNVRESPSSDYGEDNLKDFMKDIANPTKIRGDDDESESDGGESGLSVDYEGDGDLYSTGSESPEKARRKSYYEEEDQPSQGFLTIADEKADILFRLEVIRRQGIEPRKFSVRDDIREMRAELNRIKTHLELDRSLKFSRKAVVGLSAALEFLNDKVDVLDLELDGWSDQMHQAVYTQKEYDTIFEELFFKYRGKVQTPPEIRLLLTFGASALTFHMSNVMAKKVAKNIEDGEGGGSFMDSIAKMMGGGNKAAGPQIRTPEPVASKNESDVFQQLLQQNLPPVRKEMKPPSFAFPEFGMNPQMTSPPPPVLQGLLPTLTRETDLKSNFQNNIRDDESERLSDIPSDLESPPLSNFGSPEKDTKTIEVTKTPRKTRARGAAKAKPRIIEI